MAPPRSARETRSSSASTRSRTAGTASGGSTDSSCSCAAGLPGDLVRARATKVKRGFAEATRTELARAGPGPRRRALPAFRRLRRLPLPGPTRTSGRSPRRHDQVRDALVRLGGFPSRRSSRSCLPRSDVRLSKQARVLVRARRRGSRARVPPRRPLGRGHRRRGVPAHDGPRERRPRGGAASGRASEGLEPYDQETQTGYLRHLVVREGRNTGQLLVLLVTAPGERFDADFLIETLTRFPEVRSIHWAVNDRPAEVTNLPTRLLWGEEWIEEELLGLRFRVRPNAFLQTNTEMAETLYALAREAAAADRHGDGLRPLLRHRDDRPLARRRRRRRCGASRSPRSPSRARSRTRTANGVDNARFFAGNVGQSLEELAERAGSPDVVVVDPPRAGLAGKALRRTGALRRPRHRLRLLQPDDARIRSRGAARRVRLRARSLHPGRHVPAHAAHRERLVAHACTRFCRRA